jgi:hypothetical protein
MLKMEKKTPNFETTKLLLKNKEKKKTLGKAQLRYSQ